LKQVQDSNTDTLRIRDCLGNVDRLCTQAIQLFAALDKLVQEFTPRQTKGRSSGKPSVIKWIHRKLRFSQLTEQLTHITNSLAAALHMLQGVQNTTMATQTLVRVDLLLENVEMLRTAARTGTGNTNTTPPDSQFQNWATQLLDMYNRGPYLESGTETRVSSTESFHTTASDNETSARSINSQTSVISFASTLVANVACERFCQCQCHLRTRLQTPWWARRLFGSLMVHGNMSILLNGRACNKTYCRRHSPLDVQISYVTPAWPFLKAFMVYMTAEAAGRVALSINISTPRIIPYTAPAWALVELGKISELRQLLSLRLASPYDVNLDGVSLLKVCYPSDRFSAI
jgi:hypothetical protein